MAEIRSSGTWGSALSADEFAAIRSVGFEPVGQVFGAAVYSAGARAVIAAPGRRDRPAAGCRPGLRSGYPAGRPGVIRPARADHGPGAAHGHRPDDHRVRRTGWPRRGRRPAVLAKSFPSAGRSSRPSAPRSARRAVPRGQPVPFTGEVSGQDFAKLIMAGWVPAGLVLGISIASRHDDRKTNRQARWGQAMPRSPAGPSWSASRGTTPGASWKMTSGGSAPRAW